MEELYEYDEEFRDSIATVDNSGKRIWVYPKKPKGAFHNKRALVSIFFLGLLFSGPFIRIGGQPLLLFNVFERKFVLFGIPFWPQDFYLFGLATITFFVFVILFTVIFGRIWCGWACPQTIFMEMVFRKIEYWIEGDASQQRKLDNGPLTSAKIFKKLSKHLIYLSIAVLIAHTLIAYLVGVDGVINIITASPTENTSLFGATVFFIFLFYWVFAYFREQACVVVCPYGRLQGVLLNKDSMTVVYDWLRGEPRGKIHKNEKQEGVGDCVDCKLCVHVCPTGIDIRNGTQLECVNCTACVDACDEVMEKVHRPKGLIRISSYNNIAEGKKALFTTRVIGYSFVLAVLVGVLSYMLITRPDIDASVLKASGQLYQKGDDGRIMNLYNVHLLNKKFEDVSLEMRVKDLPEAEFNIIGGAGLFLTPNSTAQGVFFIILPTEKLTGAKTKLEIEFISGNEVVATVKTNFLGPLN